MALLLSLRHDHPTKPTAGFAGTPARLRSGLRQCGFNYSLSSPGTCARIATLSSRRVPGYFQSRLTALAPGEA